MHGRLLSFLDLLAIAVAVTVIILAIVPDQPFSSVPVDWYSFTFEIDRKAKNGVATDTLQLGFTVSIDGETYDLYKRPNAERNFHCNLTGLELTCHFRGDAGERLQAAFFIRDDAFKLTQATVVTGAVFGRKIELQEQPIELKAGELFTFSHEGKLE